MKRIDESNAHLHQDGFIGREGDDPRFHRFYIRPMRLPAGERHEGHSHYVDHVTVIKTVPVQIDWHNPETGESDSVLVTKPCKILIKAEVHHAFQALENEVEWECWFWDTPEAAAGASRG